MSIPGIKNKYGNGKLSVYSLHVLLSNYIVIKTEPG